jgi:glyoxylase-like metal-dependent hydrolase (beta-lactamase superfamily II)
LNEIRQVHFCDVTVEGDLWPVFGWTIAGEQGTILVDTGMVESTPELDAEWGPVLRAWVSVLFTPGHSPGHQAVVVETDDGLVVLGGDVTYSMRELIDGATESIQRIHALRPRAVYLAHHERPWVPDYD